MANGCMYYVIQECDGSRWEPEDRDLGPWRTVTAPIRDSFDVIERKYQEHCAKTDEHISVRLAAVRVLKQRNGVTQKIP